MGDSKCQSDPAQCPMLNFQFGPDMSEEDQKALMKMIEEETKQLLNGKSVKNDEVKKAGIIKDIHIKIKHKYHKYMGKLDRVVDSMINTCLDSIENNNYYYQPQIDIQNYHEYHGGYHTNDNQANEYRQIDMAKQASEEIQAKNEKERKELDDAKTISKVAYKEQEQARSNEHFVSEVSKHSSLDDTSCGVCGRFTPRVLDCKHHVCSFCVNLSRKTRSNKFMCPVHGCGRLCIDYTYLDSESEKQRMEEEEARFDRLTDHVIGVSKLFLEDEKALAEALAKSAQEERDREIERMMQQEKERIIMEKKNRETIIDMINTTPIDFDSLADQMTKINANKGGPKYRGGSLNGKSALILAIIELLENSPTIDYILGRFAEHTSTVRDICLTIRSTTTFENNQHIRDPHSSFNVSPVLNYLVHIYIRGDGNCLWSSVSHNLFGDYSMMESLRLLTAAALLNYEQEFLDLLDRQATKYNYRHVLTFEDLLRSATILQTWGDELHIMALSLALERPIFSYGSLKTIPDIRNMNYEQFKLAYETEAVHNHFKYIGDTAHTDREAILLHYDGQTHYSAVLKREDKVEPLVPFVQIIELLVDHQVHNGQQNDHDNNDEDDEEEENKEEKFAKGMHNGEFSMANVMVNHYQKNSTKEEDMPANNRHDNDYGNVGTEELRNEIMSLQIENVKLKEKNARNDDIVRAYEQFYRDMRKMFIGNDFDCNKLSNSIYELEAELRK